MIGVIVPAHNEERHIGACLASLRCAAECAALEGESVLLVVVADACNDRTAALARRAGAVVMEVEARNVGIARAAGARHALDAGARWLAFTDADTLVAPDWLAAQLALGGDAVCGTVEVRDWGSHGEALRHRFAARYVDADGHRHVHGANLGVSASAYVDAGGFQPLVCSEDVQLVDALQESGASIVWSAAPRVITSARRDFRAAGGFGATLVAWGDEATPRDGRAARPAPREPLPRGTAPALEGVASGIA